MSKLTKQVNAPAVEKSHILILGSHPYNTMGYSKVMYNIAKQFEFDDSFRYTIFGFQNSRTFLKEGESGKEHNRQLDESKIKIFDAHKYDNPIKQQGFGYEQIQDVVELARPSHVIIFNDPFVTSHHFNKLLPLRQRLGFNCC